MQIKERCWRYDTVKGAYFVKFYEDERQANKVRHIHQQLEAIEFPYAIPITSQNSSPYVVQRWVVGEAANYGQWQDRTQTLNMLQELHVATKDWVVPYMPKQNIKQKWQGRLYKFQQQEEQLSQVLGPAFATIVQQAADALQTMPPLAPTQLSVLHGDVVHHNFLLGEQPVCIDFDLCYLGDPKEEVMMWMHRVLPHMDYNVQELLAEQPYAASAQEKIHYLRYPNELLREWLYYLQLDGQQQARLFKDMQAFTERALYYYPQMNEQLLRLSS